ncbi:ATP-binding protein [Streptomyces mangrovisoli]|nr:ATP-binding protein [Streptomyces mangrovisoli]
MTRRVGTVVLMCGLPGSGKTTYGANSAPNWSS